MIAGKELSLWLSEAHQRENFLDCGLFASPNRRRVKHFAQHVMLGETSQAEDILRDNPASHFDLLTTRVKVKRHLGGRLDGTALQIALVKDYRTFGYEVGMVEMLERHLLALPDGAAIIASQVGEKFPDGSERGDLQPFIQRYSHRHRACLLM